MKDVLEQRLQSLRAEYEAGQKMLTDLDAKRQTISTTLLRIEGAMQVLKELLSQQDASGGAGSGAPPDAAG